MAPKAGSLEAVLLEGGEKADLPPLEQVFLRLEEAMWRKMDMDDEDGAEDVAEELLLQSDLPMILRARVLIFLSTKSDGLSVEHAEEALRIIDTDVRQICTLENLPFPLEQYELATRALKAARVRDEAHREASEAALAKQDQTEEASSTKDASETGGTGLQAPAGDRLPLIGETGQVPGKALLNQLESLLKGTTPGDQAAIAHLAKEFENALAIKGAGGLSTPAGTPNLSRQASVDPDQLNPSVAPLTPLTGQRKRYRDGPDPQRGSTGPKDEDRAMPDIDEGEEDVSMDEID